MVAASRLVKTAVFPVAGMGTRFLPVTKSLPKEMLPVVDRPLIHYAVDEAIKAGMDHLIFVTNSNKRALEDYFDSHFELESRLQAAEKWSALESVVGMIPAGVTISYVRQSAPRGLGDAILCARPLVGDQPFAVLLADDFLVDGWSILQRMCRVFQDNGSSVLATMQRPDELLSRYGVVGLDADQLRVTSIVEKPATRALAPSNFAVLGRYVLSPLIFDYLSVCEPGVGGEVQLTDAIALMLASQRVQMCPFDGVHFDCGVPLGLLQATMHEAMQRPELAAGMRSFFLEHHADIEG